MISRPLARRRAPRCPRHPGEAATLPFSTLTVKRSKRCARRGGEGDQIAAGLQEGVVL